MRLAQKYKTRLSLLLASLFGGTGLWLVGGAGVGPALADGADLAEVVDLRVGENDQASRLVIVCDGPCRAEIAGDGFHLSGLDSDMMVDLSERGGFIRTLSLRPDSSGTYLSVETDAKPDNVAIVTCGDTAQICIDFLKPVAKRGAAVTSSASAAVSPAPKPEPRPKSTPVEPLTAAAGPPPLPTPKPHNRPEETPRNASLRMTASGSVAGGDGQALPTPALASGAKPPIRLRKASTLPPSAPQPAGSKPAVSAPSISKPVPTAPREQAPPADSSADSSASAKPRLRTDLGSPIITELSQTKPMAGQADSFSKNNGGPKQAVRMIMNKEAISFLSQETGLALTPAACTSAQTILQKDAWDLESYRLFSLCLAAAGHEEQAYGLLTRLEKYAPDDALAKQAKAAIMALSLGRSETGLSMGDTPKADEVAPHLRLR